MGVGKDGCHVMDLHIQCIFENYFIKVIEHFSCLHSLILTLRGLGEFSKVIQTRDILVVKGLNDCLEFSQPVFKRS